MGEEAKYLCHAGVMQLITVPDMHDKTDLNKCYRIFYPSKSQWLLSVSPTLKPKSVFCPHSVFHATLTINSDYLPKQQ
jgi:hypothetical protein